MEKQTSNLILTLDKHNRIVLTLPNGELVDIQLAKKQKVQATVSIKASRDIKIHRESKDMNRETKEVNNG